jgi:hypothetical protein
MKASHAQFAAVAKAVKAAQADADKYNKGYFSTKQGHSPEGIALRILDKVARVQAIGKSAGDPELDAAKAAAVADLYAIYNGLDDGAYNVKGDNFVVVSFLSTT